MRAEDLPRSRLLQLLFVLALLLLLAARPAPLPAQAPAGPAAEAPGPRVLVLTHALDPEAERTFQEVLVLSLRLTLERRGVQPLFEARPATAQRLSAEPAAVSAAGAAAVADCVLLAEYQLAEGDLEVQLSWHERGRGAATAQVTRRGRRDLALDRVILEAAETLLREADPDLQARPPAALAAAAPAAAGLPVGPPPPGAGETLPQAPASEPETAASPAIGVPPGEDLPSGTVAARPKRVDIGLGAAPFVTTGAASEYFKLGIVPVLSAAFLFRGEYSRFGLGLYAGANLFSAEGSMETATAFLVPAGLALRYELGRTTAALIIFGLSGGPAVIGMSTSGGEQHIGLTFFGRASLGIRLPIGNVFGIAAEAGYDLYWEQPYPIMGFCPAIYASIRL